MWSEVMMSPFLDPSFAVEMPSYGGRWIKLNIGLDLRLHFHQWQLPHLSHIKSEMPPEILLLCEEEL